MEYWNVDLNKEVTHLLMRLRRINLPGKSDFANPSPCPRRVHPLFHFPITHYSIIPVFQYSNCERSELSSNIGIRLKIRHRLCSLWLQPLLAFIRYSLTYQQLHVHSQPFFIFDNSSDMLGRFTCRSNPTNYTERFRYRTRWVSATAN